MARKARPVTVAKAPNAIDNDEFSSPVLGSAWLPRLCLGSFTSEVDSEALVKADTEADSDALTDSETETEADVLALCNSFNDTDSLVEIEVLTEADCDSLNDVEILVEVLVLSEALKNADVEADSDTETLDEADSE